MKKVIVSNNRIHKFDTIGNRFEFYYDEGNDSFFVFDKELNIITDLEIKIRKYKKYKEVGELKQIRYYFPKPNKIGKERYQKSVSEILFNLFGDFEGNSGSPLSLTIEDCKKIILNKYNENGYLISFTEMVQSKDSLLKKVHSFIRDNGGVKKFREITKELGLDNEIYYTDHKGVFLKSSFEFIFFSILHSNNIEYEYESFKIKRYVPDFYIPKKKILVEILGLNSRENYFIKTKEKEKLYNSEGFNYKPIIVDRHHPKESIFNGCSEILGKLKVPNFNEYNRKYTLTSKEFIKQLKIYLTEVNEGRLFVSVRKDNSGFREKYRKYYNYVLDNYETVQIGIKELVGIPSTKYNGVKIKKYWYNIQYTKDELEYVYKNEKRIPTKWESRTTYRKIYNLFNFYRFWGEDSIKEGGKFFSYVKELKKKYN